MLNGGELILRFDDIAPGMAWDKFLSVKKVLADLGVRSLLGVVPDCRDPDLSPEKPRAEFFECVRAWAADGDTIAQHGTHHLYDSADPGLLGIQPRSEFAGHPPEVQQARLARGKSILVQEGVWQPYFMAPSHSFDRHTLTALGSLGFAALTDGFGFHPYVMHGMVLVPQLTSRVLPVPFGVQTLCVHLNALPARGVKDLLSLVRRNAHRFVDFKVVAARPAPVQPWHGILRAGTSCGLSGWRKLRRAALQGEGGLRSADGAGKET
jgi:predicted deacetylase